MTEKALAFAKHYDIFCRAAGTMKTSVIFFDKEKLTWDEAIPQTLDFFSAEAAAYKATKGLNDEQLLEYIRSKLVETCEEGDDLLIIFED